MEEIGDKRLYIMRWGQRVRECVRACVLYYHTKLWSKFYISALYSLYRTQFYISGTWMAQISLRIFAI